MSVDPEGLADGFVGGHPIFVRGVPKGSCSSGGQSFAAPLGINFNDVYKNGVSAGIMGIPNTGLWNYSAGKAAIAQFGSYDYQRNIAANSFIPAILTQLILSSGFGCVALALVNKVCGSGAGLGYDTFQEFW